MSTVIYHLWLDIKWYARHPLADLVRKVRLRLGHGHYCDYRYDRLGFPTDSYTGFCNKQGFHRGRNA